jgi:predicted  nucleic acid-binding Zn-ribbon protein
MNDHIPDTTKMINATPRMDASAHDDGAIWQTGCDIERELNAANVEIEEKRKDVVWLATEKAKLEERIKRLEEAGDALEYASVVLEAGEDPNGFEKLLLAQREWREAKEAKP